MAKEIVHKDYWGEDITIGDIVLFITAFKELRCGVIIRSAAKKVRVEEVCYSNRNRLVYPCHVIKTDPAHATYLKLSKG